MQEFYLKSSIRFYLPKASLWPPAISNAWRQDTAQLFWSIIHYSNGHQTIKNACIQPPYLLVRYDQIYISSKSLNSFCLWIAFVFAIPKPSHKFQFHI